MAVCGVCLVFFGWPFRSVASPGGHQQARAPRVQLQERHQRALAGLQSSGLTGIVGIVDFGDGLGLAVTQDVEIDGVLMRVPESMAFDVGKARSCIQGEAEEPAMLDCQIERAVVSAVAANEASQLTGMLALLVMERRRGSAPGLRADSTTEVLATLPEPSWQKENGIFAVDEDEFKIFGTGTSMEGWRDVAVNATAQAQAFISDKLPHLEEVSLEEIRWAYLMLHSRVQWAEEFDISSSLELPQGALFLWPLFLARPTPEWEHGVRLRHDEDAKMYEVIATHAMRPGDEVHFVDRRLSDASVLCFQGLWLNGRHRMRLSLNVSAARRDPEAQTTLNQYGCGSQPLHLYVMAQKSVDAHFMSCMRMLALAANATKLRRAEGKGWMNRWPVTGMVDQKTEAAATELAINVLQQVLARIGSSSALMKQRFGADTAAARPTVHVREAETMIVVGLLKSMKELHMVSGNEYLFEALRDTEGGKQAGEKGAESGKRK